MSSMAVLAALGTRRTLGDVVLATAPLDADVAEDMEALVLAFNGRRLDTGFSVDWVRDG